MMETAFVVKLNLICSIQQAADFANANTLLRRTTLEVSSGDLIYEVKRLLIAFYLDIPNRCSVYFFSEEGMLYDNFIVGDCLLGPDNSLLIFAVFFEEEVCPAELMTVDFAVLLYNLPQAAKLGNIQVHPDCSVRSLMSFLGINQSRSLDHFHPTMYCVSNQTKQIDESSTFRQLEQIMATSSGLTITVFLSRGFLDHHEFIYPIFNSYHESMCAADRILSELQSKNNGCFPNLRKAATNQQPHRSTVDTAAAEPHKNNEIVCPGAPRKSHLIQTKALSTSQEGADNCNDLAVDGKEGSSEQPSSDKGSSLAENTQSSVDPKPPSGSASGKPNEVAEFEDKSILPGQENLVEATMKVTIDADDEKEKPRSTGFVVTKDTLMETTTAILGHEKENACCTNQTATGSIAVSESEFRSDLENGIVEGSRKGSTERNATDDGSETVNTSGKAEEFRSDAGISVEKVSADRGLKGAEEFASEMTNAELESEADIKRHSAKVFDKLPNSQRQSEAMTPPIEAPREAITFKNSNGTKNLSATVGKPQFTPKLTHWTNGPKAFSEKLATDIRSLGSNHCNEINYSYMPVDKLKDLYVGYANLEQTIPVSKLETPDLYSVPVDKFYSIVKMLNYQSKGAYNYLSAVEVVRAFPRFCSKYKTDMFYHLARDARFRHKVFHLTHSAVDPYLAYCAAPIDDSVLFHCKIALLGRMKPKCYGWGLYFSENPLIAMEFAEKSALGDQGWVKDNLSKSNLQ